MPSAVPSAPSCGLCVVRFTALSNKLRPSRPKLVVRRMAKILGAFDDSGLRDGMWAIVPASLHSPIFMSSLACTARFPPYMRQCAKD